MTNETTLPDLLPCPFCGGAPELIAPSPNDGVYVECRHCFVYGPEVQAAPAAIEHWNKRHAEQATANLRAKLEQCRADAERFVAMIEAGISEDGGSPNACAKYLTTRRVAAYGSIPKTVDGWRKIIDAARGAK